MKKNWKKPTLVALDDSQITSAGPEGFNQWEAFKYCDGAVTKTLLPAEGNAQFFCIPPGGNAHPDCVAVGDDGVKGVDWFNIRVGARNGTLSTANVGACS